MNKIGQSLAIKSYKSQKLFYSLLVIFIILITTVGAYIVTSGYGLFALTFAILFPLSVLLLDNIFIGVLMLVFMIPMESAFLSVSSSGALSYTRILGILIFGLWVMKIAVGRRKLNKSDSHRWIFSLFLWAALSLFWAVNQDAAISRIITMLQLIAMFLLIMNEVSTPKRLAIVIGLFFASCLLSTTLALMGVDTKFRGGLLALENQGVKEFATYTGIVLLLAILYVSLGSSKYKEIALASILISIFPLLASAERGVLVALGVSLLSVILIIRQKNRLLFFSVLVIAILAITLQILVSSGLLDETILIRFTPRNVFESGGASRIDIWKVGLNLAMDNLFIGVGLENFIYQFYRYISSVDIVHNLDLITDPHSDLLRITGELGLVGVFFYLGMMFVSARQIYQASRLPLNEEFHLLIIMVMALFVFYFVNGLFSSFIWRKGYWYVIGLTAAVPNILGTYYRESNNSSGPEK